MNVLITGAAGYIGRQLVDQLLKNGEHRVVAADIHKSSPFLPDEMLTYVELDVRSKEAAGLMEQHEIHTVVHLASIVTPGKKSNREFEYTVDVLGTKNILNACVAAGVKRIIISSSGAAYGYHADNPEWLMETDSLRGNVEFAYSYHKRLVEEMLSEYRIAHPELEQTIFRIGTILGDSVNNQITNLFEKPVLLGIAGSRSPFVFIWDQDVVACFMKAIDCEIYGIYNVAGDGALTVDELGILLNNRVVKIPASIVKSGLFAMKRLSLSQYGEEQVAFLRYRPVLSNDRLKNEFGYKPMKTSIEVFEYYMLNRLKQRVQSSQI
jgi:UDP-glucose 4-epimerase